MAGCMKKRWRKTAAVLMFGTVLGLAGCAAPAMVSSDEFAGILKQAQFVETIPDLEEEVPGYRCYSQEEAGLVAEYSSYPDEYEASLSFENVARLIEYRTPANGASWLKKEFGNYSSYQVTSPALYSVLVRKGTKLVFMEGPAERKQEIENLMKKAGALS